MGRVKHPQQTEWHKQEQKSKHTEEAMTQLTGRRSTKVDRRGGGGGAWEM